MVGKPPPVTILVLVLGAALALSGCHQQKQAADGGGGTTSPVAAKGLTKAGTWPLTGLPAKGRTPKHPVLVVKIDNSVNSAPQVGLSKADLITEELVEGGITRLAVFFYQRTPTLVGPVRSMRASDIGIVKPAKAVLVASGGAPPTIARVKAAGIHAFTEGATGFQRDNAREAPYNLFMHLNVLAKKVKATATVPSYLPFGSAASLPRGTRAAGMSAVFSGGHTTRWTYTKGHYVNLNSNAAAGDRFTPVNVLVLRVRIGNAGYLDPAGNPVPVTEFTGTGKALLLHGGRAVPGRWKKSLTSPISLSTIGGGRLRVPRGRTWIELVPAKDGRVLLTR